MGAERSVSSGFAKKIAIFALRVLAVNLIGKSIAGMCWIVKSNAALRLANKSSIAEAFTRRVSRNLLDCLLSVCPRLPLGQILHHATM